MRFKTSRDLLELAAELHGGLARYYERLSGDASKEKVRLLLDYLARHEQQLADAVKRYEQEAPDAVRNAWFSQEVDMEFVKCIPPAKPVAEMSVDEVIDLALQLDDCISGLYQMIAMQSELPAVREAFSNLVARERQEKMRMVRQAMQLNEM